MAFVYVSIGSNIHAETNICSCIRHLQQSFSDTVLSSIYQTPAEGFIGNPFLNLVAGFSTNLSPGELQTHLKNLEAIHDRQRTQEKFSSRTLDVDLLLYDDLNLLPASKVPHPDITAYPFVLFPLADIAPTVIHPILQCSIHDIAVRTKLSRQGMHNVELDCIKQSPRLTRKFTP